MNVVKENVDELNAVLKVQINKTDYDEKVLNVLKEYRKKANMPGFRPGKVPLGIINKMYRIPVLQEEINKLVSESITKYITDEKLKILGEPLPKFEKSATIEWENQEDFEFDFEIALQPEFEVNIPKSKIKYYTIKVDDELINKSVSNYAKRFGSMKQVDEITDNEMLKADLAQIDQDGNIIEDGIKVNDAVISVDRIQDKDIKEQFKGKKINDVLNIDLKKALVNETEISGLLKINKEKVAEIGADFNLTIKEITKFIDSEINQELFDKAFGKDNVKSEEEFKNKISDDLKAAFKDQSEYKFAIDVKELLISKNVFELPSEFLKKWLRLINKDKITDEQFEKEFPAFEEDLKWQLIKNKIIEENDLKVEDDEIINLAKKSIINQFKQYGLATVEDEYIENYAKDILKKDEEKKKLIEQKYEEKTINFIKETLKIEDKEIKQEDFYKLFENK